MPKRNRTRSRLEQFYNLALASHQRGWPEQLTARELEILIDKNVDLVEEKAKQTARREFWAMANPQLNGFLEPLYRLAERKMADEPPGTKLRINHEVKNFCDRAVKHPIGPGGTLREIEAEL
jgi:hypothetical protein